MYMTVRKPLEKSIREDEIDALIDKGAHVKNDEANSRDEWTNINLRIPKRMLGKINITLSSRIGMTRTSWILEAIQEKLERD